MKSALLIAIGISVGTAVGAPVEWKVSEGGNGHWYEIRVSDQAISWTAADSVAASAGGYLASITSAEENQFVFALSQSTPGAWYRSTDPIGIWYYGPWIGGQRDPAAASGWSWTSGEAWSYAAWYFNQPDSSAQSYVAFGVGVNDTPAAVWADTFDYEPVHSFVVEYTIPAPTTLSIVVAMLGVSARRQRRSV